MRDDQSSDESAIVSRDQVRKLFHALLIGAQRDGWTDQTLEAASRVKARTIKGYRVEGKEPSPAAMLSIALVLGADAVNAILSLIGYGGAHPLDEPETIQPGIIVAELVENASVIARAAADGRIDHTEKPGTTKAADKIIEVVLPLSSMAEAG